MGPIWSRSERCRRFCGAWSNSIGWRRAVELTDQPSTPIPPVLKVVGLVVFASTLFTRAVDPVIPRIASDLGVDVSTAALLSTAYTFPYALVQPVLGTLGDLFGKTRLMNVSLFVLGLAALVCAATTDFSVLVAMRVIAGLVAGGVFPAGMALIGDLVPVHQRQVGIGRLLAVALTGNLLGASIAGVIADALGWRGIFVAFGLFALLVAGAAYFAFRNVAAPKPKRFRLSAVSAGFRSVFSDPRAKICFGAVFLEAVFIHGLFPFVAILLLASGQASAAVAGIVIACFGVGGVIYSVSVPMLVANIPDRGLMISGGLVVGSCLAVTALGLPWYVQAAVFAVYGFGFYLLHGSIQVHVTELSSTARGLAASLHSCFFYLGQAIGPIVYRYGFARDLQTPTMLAGAVVLVMVGFGCAALLRHRASVD
jgi:predicted MFS family arabinose efflux permease